MAWKARGCLKKNNYDLLLLDVKMPTISGLQILKEAKEKKPKTKVIVLTAKLGIDRSLKGESVPLGGIEQSTLLLADYIMAKPFDVAELLDKIKELLNSQMKQ